jgi:hypothetical protein
MNLVARVKGILLSPATEWPLIDLESHTVKDLYLSYLLPLAGIGALATLIGTMLFGYSMGPVTVRYSFVQAFSMALLGLVMVLLVAFVLAWIIDLLAPTFKGQKNFLKAFAVAAFALTGSLVGSFAAILPALGWLFALLGGLYSIYLLYKGLPVLMKTPTDKALGYTVVVVIASIVCNVILTALFAAVMPTTPWSSVGAGLGGRAGDGEISITTPTGTVATTQGRLEEVARQLEAAAKKAEQGSQKQDPQAVSQAATDAVAAVTGMLPGSGRAPLSSEALKAWLPPTLNGMKRDSFEVQGGNALGITGTTGRASYRDGDRHLDLEVLDAGGISGLLAMISGLQTGERETDGTREKSYQVGKRKYTEKHWKNDERAELTIVLANGVVVTANAQGVPFDAVQAAVKGLGLEQLEAVQPAPVQAGKN